jgi:hypothetical protein
MLLLLGVQNTIQLATFQGLQNCTTEKNAK